MAAAVVAGVLVAAHAGLDCARPASGQGADTALNAPMTNVHFIGRFDTSDPLGPKFAWPASGMRARFVGTGIDMRLRTTGNDEFQVVIDGTPTSVVRCSPTRDVYSLASGLTDGTHDIEVYKRTEARVGQAQFLGFAPSSGRPLLPPADRPARKIEFIGDSITAGYGAEGAGATCHFTPSTENEFLAYGALAARSVGAEHFTVAWAGKSTENLANIYDRTLPLDTRSRWDFQTWVPDAVVINLGTNDFAAGDPGQVTMTSHYQRFVERVRANYPSAHIFCVLGPMLADTYPPGQKILTHARKYLRSVVDALNAKGDARVTFLEFPVQDFANGLGCDYHPNLTTHRLMADQLADALRTQLGW